MARTAWIARSLSKPSVWDLMSCSRGCFRSSATLRKLLTWQMSMGIISSAGKSGSKCVVTWNLLQNRSSAFGSLLILTMGRIRTVEFPDGSYTIILTGKSLLRSLGVMALATLILGAETIRSSISFLIWEERMDTLPLPMNRVRLFSQLQILQRPEALSSLEIQEASRKNHIHSVETCGLVGMI